MKIVVALAIAGFVMVGLVVYACLTVAADHERELEEFERQDAAR